jgi:hypothetical protein
MCEWQLHALGIAQFTNKLFFGWLMQRHRDVRTGASFSSTMDDTRRALENGMACSSVEFGDAKSTN